MLKVAGGFMGTAFMGAVPFHLTRKAIGESVTASSGLKITGMDVFVIRATYRTNWIFVRLKTNRGLTGLGEASLGSKHENTRLKDFFEMTREQSPFEIEAYRQRGWKLAKTGGLTMATAFSAIEQALWDLVGKILDAPLYDLFGGKLRNNLPVYANINQSVKNRVPGSFAVNAGKAAEDGFRAIKAAPFDGFPKLTAPKEEIAQATEKGIACVEAIRQSIGPDVDLMIDCHSYFDVELAVSVAQKLEPYDLYWYEEPVPPERIKETVAIRREIKQRMAGGEMLFGMEGFAPLCHHHAVDIIMPDVKHCGGIHECRKIATVAESEDNVLVSPHNPSGPVSTAANVQVCAGLPNFDILEYQWNEVPWRGDLVIPPEQFHKGSILVPVRPGFGIELNEKLVQKHLY